MVWLIYSDEELLAAKCNGLAVNRTFSGRCFTGCLPFFKVGQGGILEKQEATAEEAEQPICELIPLSNINNMSGSSSSSNLIPVFFRQAFHASPGAV